MTFKQALKELIEITGGEHCSLEYEVQHRSNGVLAVKICAYSNAHSYTSEYCTFEEVLTAMKRKVNGEQDIPDKANIKDG